MHFVLPLRRSILLTLSLLSACAAAGVTSQGTPMTPNAPRVKVTGAPGAFLGGRFAASEGDPNRATDLFLQGLQRDPGNPDMQLQAFLAALMAGRPEAITLARTQQNNMIAQLVLGNADAKEGRWGAAEGRFAALSRQGPQQLLQPLLVAWSQQGGGRTDAALATLKPLVDGQRFRGGFALHAAMIADLAGRDGEAGRLYKVAQNDSGGLNLQLARILASWEVRQNRTPVAQQIFANLQDNSGDIAIAVPAMYLAAATRPVRSATDGMAETYLALAGALRGQESNELALAMLRLALDVRPDLSVARLLSADIMDASKHPEQALEMLKPIAASDPLAAVVRLRQAALSERTGKSEAALQLLDDVATDNPQRSEPWAMRGDILRGQRKFEDAVAAYDKAIARVSRPTKANWPLFYERGIALERSQNWPRAEADFQRALELSPDEPYVLNYLGYSWTEQNMNLPRARQMIERAVEQRPNDGAVIDSLGWVVLRQGNVAEAVRLLQRATELQPADATVNFHLGDAYWAAGRKLEAQFQWRRSLNLSPEPDDVPRLEAKLRESEIVLGNLPTPKPMP
jgi:tetratricopeptide (TPR) repeat protein